MMEQVDADKIEAIVGEERSQTLHIGRAVSAEETFYILHSQECFDSTPNLLECLFSKALDAEGIDPTEWPLDQPVVLALKTTLTMKTERPWLRKDEDGPSPEDIDDYCPSCRVPLQYCGADCPVKQ